MTRLGATCIPAVDFAPPHKNRRPHCQLTGGTFTPNPVIAPTPMKSMIHTASLISALAFALAAVAQFAGLVTIPGISTFVLSGGLVVFCVVVFMVGDYGRTPAFRVRRTASDSTDAGPTVNRPAGPGPDWTYTTRSK